MRLSKNNTHSVLWLSNDPCFSRGQRFLQSTILLCRYYLSGVKWRSGFIRVVGVVKGNILFRNWTQSFTEFLACTKLQRIYKFAGCWSSKDQFTCLCSGIIPFNEHSYSLSPNSIMPPCSWHINVFIQRESWYICIKLNINAS